MNTLLNTTWYGFQAIRLESEQLRVIMVPELGAKIVSLFDKVQAYEWLVPPMRPLKPTLYGADFVSQDMSGWDEMFPTIIACDYPGKGAQQGISLPDHGEVWSLPWEVDQAGPDKLTLSITGPILPYRLTRTAELVAANILQLSYQLVNLGEENMPYLWSAHPQFTADSDTEIVLPAQVTEVCNTIAESWGWGAMERRYTWPEALAVNGSVVRIDRIGPPSLHTARKFFVPPEVRVDWAGLLRRTSKHWLRFEWDARQIPYLGIWVDEGAINSAPVAAPEPMTGYYDSLAVAWHNQRVATIDPGALQNWTLVVRVGTGEEL
jgi:galactose mutarotase-like enzyme